MTCTCATGRPTCPFCERFDLGEANTELDALAEAFGENLRLDHDPDAPMLWAVWGNDPMADEDDDIIGAGNTPSEAIEDARRQINEWNAKWVADQRRQMGVGR